MTVGRIFAVIALIGLAALSAWLLETVKSEREPIAKARPHTPDYTLENFTASAMDIRGKLHDRLQAQIMLHYPDDDSSELTKPHIELYRQDAPPWRVDAEKGWVYSKGELVLLQDDVFIERDAVSKDGPLHIVTRDVRVRPKDKYAETDQPVAILQGTARIDAVGMRAYFQEGRLELLSAVRGKYDPKLR